MFYSAYDENTLRFVDFFITQYADSVTGYPFKKVRSRISTQFFLVHFRTYIFIGKSHKSIAFSHFYGLNSSADWALIPWLATDLEKDTG